MFIIFSSKSSVRSVDDGSLQLPVLYLLVMSPNATFVIHLHKLVMKVTSCFPLGINIICLSQIHQTLFLYYCLLLILHISVHFVSIFLKMSSILTWYSHHPSVERCAFAFRCHITHRGRVD